MSQHNQTSTKSAESVGSSVHTDRDEGHNNDTRSAQGTGLGTADRDPVCDSGMGPDAPQVGGREGRSGLVGFRSEENSAHGPRVAVAEDILGAIPTFRFTAGSLYGDKSGAPGNLYFDVDCRDSEGKYVHGLTGWASPALFDYLTRTLNVEVQS